VGTNPPCGAGWLLLTFAGIYLVSCIAVLGIGLHPVIPWTLAIGILCLNLPFATIFEYYGNFNVPFIAVYATVPAAIVAHIGTLWFVWAAAALLVLALPGARRRRRQWKLFIVGMATVTLGYGSLWNVNCLLARYVPLGSLHDPSLKAFDIWFYSLVLGKEVSYAGLFPLVHNPVMVRLFDNAYVMLFSEIVLVVMLTSESGEAKRLIRFVVKLFSMYAVGIVSFLIYPAIQPTAYFPESLDVTRAVGTTPEFAAGIMRDYKAASSGGTLQGYVYFIALPSLHVMLALFLQGCLHGRPTLFRLFLPINTMIVLSTLVLGCHYVLDVVFAALLMCIAVAWTKMARARRRTTCCGGEVGQLPMPNRSAAQT
jgi:hypothetical protein